MNHETSAINASIVDRVQRTQGAVSGLAFLMNQFADEQSRPPDWGEYHRGILVSALSECVGNLEDAISDLVDAAQEPRQPERGANGLPHDDIRSTFQRQEAQELAALQKAGRVCPLVVVPGGV